ncbi:MAG: hypothetical protein WA790_03840 [Sulfitobacter sp.]
MDNEISDDVLKGYMDGLATSTSTDLILGEPEGFTTQNQPKRATSVKTALTQGIPGATNYCGQAAAASVLTAWGKNGGKTAEQLLAEIYGRFPPDGLPDGGTSAGALQKILQSYGLRSTYRTIPAWLPGGFMNPANQGIWHAYRMEIEGYLGRGWPIIVAVDTGMLPNRTNDAWWALHYVVYTAHNGGSVTLANAFNGSGQYADVSMPTNKFHEAWELRMFPTGYPKFWAIVPYE